MLIVFYQVGGENKDISIAKNKDKSQKSLFINPIEIWGSAD